VDANGRNWRQAEGGGRAGTYRPWRRTLMLRALRVPIGWKELAKRTAKEVLADNCLNLAAQLAYYFFLALFPALLFLVALLSFIPITGLLEGITSMLSRVAPGEVLSIIQDQILKIAHGQNGGLLTLGMLGTIWSMSSGINAIIDTLNQAYDIQEGRPWWKVKAIAVGLTLALAVFIVISLVLVIAGPTIAEKLAVQLHLGSTFAWTWKVVQWPVVFALVTLAIALIYYYAPDAEQEWIWITPGSVLATVLWLAISLAFKFYIANFTAYNATYGTIGGVIVLMLWFYVSSLAVLVGAELNAEIEHASPYGKDPGEKVPGEKKKIGAVAERAWQHSKDAGTFVPAMAAVNCDVDADLAPAPSCGPTRRASDWILSGLVLGQVAFLTYAKLRARFNRQNA
jgi:membrane protein